MVNKTNSPLLSKKKKKTNRPLKKETNIIIHCEVPLERKKKNIHCEVGSNSVGTIFAFLLKFCLKIAIMQKSWFEVRWQLSGSVYKNLRLSLIEIISNF